MEWIGTSNQCFNAVDMKIQCFWLVKSICKHPISWLLRKIGCLATVAMLLRVSVGTTPENVKVDVKDICAKFHAFTTIRAFFAPIAQTTGCFSVLSSVAAIMA